jgi:uncharacterized protein
MIIDADAHWTPKFNPQSGLVNNWISQYLDRKQDKFSHAETRVQELISLKIDRQLLNPMGISLGLNYAIDPELSTHVMSLYNNFMLELCSEFKQFDTNLWVGLQNIPSCVKEIQSRLDHSFFGIYVSDIVAYGFKQDMEALWQLLAENKIPLYMHLTEDLDAQVLIHDPSWQKLYDTLEFEFNNKKWIIAVASLILGGTFDRYPDLRVVIAERDIDWISSMCDTMIKLGYNDPLPILKNNFWFTTEPENKDFIVHANFIGWDRLLFATDWPHDFDQGGANSRNDIDTVLNLPIDHSQQTKIFSDNYTILKR